VRPIFTPNNMSPVSNKLARPTFTIALIRDKRLNPYQARFQVPLNFTKLDLRDYLFHAYNLKVFNIRSLIRQMPVRGTTEKPGELFREDSKKFMIVEMEHPFVWPPEPEDLEPWGKQEKQEEQMMQDDRGSEGGKEFRIRLAEEAEKMREDLKELRKARQPDSGRAKAERILPEPPNKMAPVLKRFDDPSYKIRI
jgi:large subunit ribosomal protein L23